MCHQDTDLVAPQFAMFSKMLQWDHFESLALLDWKIGAWFASTVQQGLLQLSGLGGIQDTRQKREENEAALCLFEVSEKSNSKNLLPVKDEITCFISSTLRNTLRASRSVCSELLNLHSKWVREEREGCERKFHSTDLKSVINLNCELFKMPEDPTVSVLRRPKWVPATIKGPLSNNAVLNGLQRDLSSGASWRRESEAGNWFDNFLKRNQKERKEGRCRFYQWYDSTGLINHRNWRNRKPFTSGFKVLKNFLQRFARFDVIPATPKELL